jgi:CRP-like cAMP-binding protein
MESQAFSELFPLFNNASLETLEWLLSIAVEEDYSSEQVILKEDAWGKAVYLIISGWVKIQRLHGDKEITTEILGRGDLFGEMAILEESPRSTEVKAISEVTLLNIPAQRFIQILFKEPQVQHRLLQLMVQRVRQLEKRLQQKHYPSSVRLIKLLVYLAEKYGQPTEQGTEIYHIPESNLADLADLSVAEVKNVLEKLENKGLIEINPSLETLCLTNPKQLVHLTKTKNIE